MGGSRARTRSRTLTSAKETHIYFRSLDELRSRTEPGPDRAFLGSLLDDTPDGGRIRLSPGSYLTPVFVERSVEVLANAGGPVVLVGEPGKHVMEFVEDDMDVVLEGLVIRGGGGARGALALTGDNVRLTLRDCVILDTSATMEGPAAGGVNARGGQVTMERCILVGNRGSRGGGVHLAWGAQMEARSCLFIGNVATAGGGAVWAEGDAGAHFLNCTFVDNTSEDGGMGFTLQAAPATGRSPDVSLVNCVIRSADRCFGYEGLGTGPIRVSHSILPEHAREYSVLEADDATWFGVPEFTADDLPYAVAPSAEDEEGDDALDGGQASGDEAAGGSPLRVPLGCLASLVTFAVPVLLYLGVLSLLGLLDDPSVTVLHLVGGSVICIGVGAVISFVGESLIEDLVKFVVIGGGLALVARSQEAVMATLILGGTVGTFVPIFLRYWTPILERLGLDGSGHSEPDGSDHV